MFYQKIFLTLTLAICLLVAQPSRAMAPLLTTNTATGADNMATNVGTAAGFASADAGTVPQIVADLIKVFLALLGVIFVIIIIISGLKIMTAGGDAKKVQEANDTITKAVIGLLIIVAAYAITYFIFKNLPGGGTGTGGLTSGSS